MILRAYEEELGTKVDEIEFFEVFAAFRRFADIMIMFKHGPEVYDHREETMQQIKETVFHIENIYSLIRKKTNLSITELGNFIQSIKNG